RGSLGIQLVHVRGSGEVDGVGAVGIHPVEFPVAVAVGFVNDLVLVAFELGEEVLGSPFGLLLRGRFRGRHEQRQANDQNTGLSQITCHDDSPDFAANARSGEDYSLRRTDFQSVRWAGRIENPSSKNQGAGTPVQLVFFPTPRRASREVNSSPPSSTAQNPPRRRPASSHRFATVPRAKARGRKGSSTRPANNERHAGRRHQTSAVPSPSRQRRPGGCGPGRSGTGFSFRPQTTAACSTVPRP